MPAQDAFRSEAGFLSRNDAPAPEPCKYEVSASHLYIYPENGEMLIWQKADLLTCKEEQGTYFFSHKDSSVFSGTGIQAANLYAEWVTGKRQSEAVQGKMSTKSLYTILGISVGTLLIAGLLYLYTLPWLAEKATVFVPLSAEISLGDRLSDLYAGETRTIDSVNFFLGRFVSQLQLDSVYPISVKLIVSNEINAFALPGGRVYIYSALLEKIRSPEELVALLGHEVSHISKRHSLKSLSRSMASGIVLSLLFGDASGLVSRADEFRQLSYSRELETEADIHGLNIMIRNKVNPAGMLDLLHILKEETDNNPGFMHYLSTHPDALARIQTIENEPGSKLQFDQDLDLRATYEKIKSHLVSTADEEPE
ncbi:MAG TPA: M48 family metallopeptidase [Bacteroidia bacterium]|nr:M48 family metallopeptidase [Bacteroidia bacterium]